MVDAYKMESTEANYPRILLSDDVVHSASKHLADILFSADTARDNRKYLNYLRAFGRSKEYWITRISEEQNQLDAELATPADSSDEKVLEKLRWPKGFFDDNLRCWYAEKGK